VAAHEPPAGADGATTRPRHRGSPRCSAGSICRHSSCVWRRTSVEWRRP